VVYERETAIMKVLILKLAKISNAEDFAGKGFWLQLSCIAVAFVMSVFGWKISILGHLLLMLYLTLSALRVVTLHQRRANLAYFEISRLSAWQRWKLCFAVTVLDTCWTILALAVHMVIFRGLSLLLAPTWLLHLCFAILLGFTLGKVIPNFHLDLVAVLGYYLFMIVNCSGSNIQELEFFHYFTPYLQLIEMGRFHISSLYLLVTCLALVLLLVWKGQRGKQARIALLMAAFVAVGPVCYEVYGNRQQTTYHEMTVDGQPVWYSSKIPVEDVQYLAQIAVSMKKACEHYGFPINQGDFRFYKSYCTLGNFFPEIVGWNQEKETFYFNVFSSLQMSKNPELVKNVCQRYISVMLSRSEQLRNMNLATLQMKSAVEGRIIQYASQQGWLPINDYIYTPVSEFALFSCYLLEHETERYREIFEAVNEARLEEDEVWAIIEKSYPEIYQDFRIWSGKGE
jgi:hypothetical protein